MTTRRSGESGKTDRAHPVFAALGAVFREFQGRSNELTPPELAKRLAEHSKTPLAVSEVATVETLISWFFGDRVVSPGVPDVLQPVIAALLRNRRATVVCDPWAGLGTVIAAVTEATRATTAIALTNNLTELPLGRVLVASAEWRLGDPLSAIATLPAQVDVVASLLPFGVRSGRPLVLRDLDNAPIELQDDLGHLILAGSAVRLAPDGIGLFIVPSSFFFSGRSVLRQFPRLGLGVEAALALPADSFAPAAKIQTYLVIVRKRISERMFVAQLSGDTNTNLQVISNLQSGTEGGVVELGRLVDAQSFRGFASIRLAERLQHATAAFGTPATRLEELATGVLLGRSTDGFEFNAAENAVYIPLIGNSDVLDSQDDLTLKPQNYAQVIIRPERSHARFVAHFLNSELGRELRESSKRGALILKLNKQTVSQLPVFVPDLETQRAMLDVESRITAVRNTFLGLQNELGELGRELWAKPLSTLRIGQQVAVLSERVASGLQQRAAQGFDQWIESLPFPLASILRAWQATPSQDFKTRYEHLLRFFEATAEFFSVVMLSAFSGSEALFRPHKEKLAATFDQQNLSFQRASFGTWRLVTDYLGKQTRELLAGDEAGRGICAEIFSDPSLVLPAGLSDKKISAIFSVANKRRNDWSGHGGVVGQEVAQSRNEELLTQIQELRDAMADTWAGVQLVRAIHCVPRRGLFENEIALLRGSNSEFLKETRSMAMWLDVERLYLLSAASGRALQLLPLVRIGASPGTAKNACYFFSRLEPDGARFVSYHYADQPELTGHFQEATEAIKFLAGV